MTEQGQPVQQRASATAEGGRPSAVPEHLHTVTPRLVVRDGIGAIAFYKAAFAAELLDEPFFGPAGEVIHAEVRIGDSVVMLTEQAPGEGAAPPEPNAIMATYWPHVDLAWERALAAGAEVVFALADQFYGERGGRLRDPFGQQWMMSQRIESLDHEQIARRASGQDA